MEEVRPHSVFTFGPDGMTDHPDHKAVCAWTTAAFERAGPPGARLYHATMTPEWAGEFVERMNRFNVFMGPDVPPVTPRRELAIDYELPPDVLDLKLRAIDALRRELAEKVGRASVVYFSGGNPAHLAATLAGTPFWSAILDGMDQGLAYAGCSAGIACLGDVAPDSTSNDPTSAHFWRPGLGLFPKTYFGPHWDALDVYVPGLRATIVASVPSDCRLLAIDEDTAVVGDGTGWTVMGVG